MYHRHSFRMYLLSINSTSTYPEYTRSEQSKWPGKYQVLYCILFRHKTLCWTHIIRLKQMTGHLVLSLVVLTRFWGLHSILRVLVRQPFPGHQNHSVAHVSYVGDGFQRMVQYDFLKIKQELAVTWTWCRTQNVTVINNFMSHGTYFAFLQEKKTIKLYVIKVWSPWVVGVIPLKTCFPHISKA